MVCSPWLGRAAAGHGERSAARASDIFHAKSWKARRFLRLESVQCVAPFPVALLLTFDLRLSNCRARLRTSNMFEQR
jgi:hypothetical protein